MPENPHAKKDSEKETGETAEKPISDTARPPRSYYYDDACGYEIYTDDEDEDQTTPEPAETKLDDR